MSDDWNEEAQAAARDRHDAEWLEMIGKAKPADESALDIMSELEELWLALSPEKTADDFTAEIHEPFNTDDPDVDEMAAEYSDSTNADSRVLASWPLIESPIRIAYGYAYMACLAAASPDAIRMAWNAVEKASFWQGFTLGLVRVAGNSGASVSDIARKAAHARNAENRAIKSSAFEWLDEHLHECKSKDDAAEKLTKIVPVVFRTARRYVDQWHLSTH